MKRFTRLYIQWIERMIEARARQGGHFDRVWSFGWACVCAVAYLVPFYLVFWFVCLVLALIFVPDRGLPAIGLSIIRFHAEMLRWDNLLFYIYAIAVVAQCVLWYREIERAKPRVFRRLHRCTHCGYPLTAPDQPVCTECGASV